MNATIKNLTGKQFGLLTVESITDKRYRNNVIWLCKCKCGKTKEVTGVDLTTGSVKSCGKCAYKTYWNNLEIDFTKETFTGFVILNKTDRKTRGGRGNVIWKAKCNYCGREFEISSSKININKSCGCLNVASQENNPRWQGVGKLSQTLFGHIQANAKRRKIEFAVTKEYLWELMVKQDYRCAYSGEELIFPNSSLRLNKRKSNISLDRIDSSRGYIEGNVQWVTKEVNFMKQAMVELRFFELIKKIYDRRICGR